MAIREQDFVLHDQCCSSGSYSRMSTDERVAPHYRSRINSPFSSIPNDPYQLFTTTQTRLAQAQG